MSNGCADPAVGRIEPFLQQLKFKGIDSIVKVKIATSIEIFEANLVLT